MRWWRIPLLVFSLAAGNVCLPATSAILSAPALPLRSLTHLDWAMADFDGDSLPDVAITKMEARGAGFVYWLELDLSTNHGGESPAQPGFPAIASSKFGLHLTPRDVDGDHDLDIVVTMGIARQPVAVWINDGQGRFAEGDLAAYPALTCLEDLSLCAQSRPETSPLLYDQGRRSSIGLIVSNLSQSVPPSDVRPTSRPELLISRFPTGQRLARAPPSVL
jgi:FG-GAP-like repeat